MTMTPHISTLCFLLALLLPCAASAYVPAMSALEQDESLIETTQTSEMILDGTIVSAVSAERGPKGAIRFTLSISEVLLDVRRQVGASVEFVWIPNAETRSPQVGERWVVFLWECDDVPMIRSSLLSGRIVGSTLSNGWLGATDLSSFKTKVVSAAAPCSASYQVAHADVICRASIVASNLSAEPRANLRTGTVTARVVETLYGSGSWSGTWTGTWTGSGSGTGTATGTGTVTRTGTVVGTGEEITLHFPQHAGSRLGPLRCVPALENGSEYILFLSDDAGALRLVGSPWSALRVRPDGDLEVHPATVDCPADPPIVRIEELRSLVGAR